MLSWLKMGGVGLHPAICVPCVLGLNYLETYQQQAKSSLKLRALAFAWEVPMAVTVLGQNILTCNCFLWAVTSALSWEETQLSFDPEMCYLSSREALAWPQGLGKLCLVSQGLPSHYCQLPCPHCATALAKTGSPVIIQSWNWLKTLTMQWRP